VRFISASQPFAGAVYNAVPSRHDTRIASDELGVMIQRRLGLPLSALRGLDDYSTGLRREIDELGDVFQTYHNHSRRHNSVAKILARAARQALATPVHVDSLAHEAYSAGARPDVTIWRGAPDRLHHRLLEVKVVCPISINEEATGEAGSYAGFANTSPALRRGIMGCESVGGRDPVAPHYADALRKGHDVQPCIFEIFGGRQAPQRVGRARARQDAAWRGAAVVGAQLRALLVTNHLQGGATWCRCGDPLARA
jgi:hypothetical protein